ncbi:hypothetical protein CONCODRAFT_3751 [Conidiobolus coronatus NRRL 28638]|uniref:Uncharacterized protein n=1 Tax=Conidiobolus coronatus (strain ATCC 28846 / CBS 209.66 / NRRL 28638) TaxID=796925 RepID=A0A137PE48_CONC2|nr:hypothetical protein CONCODRAFT_3751 [Conidiobolus coronatus NRRL 28638]|eukprot:KXN73276.1 hypothetical protein CONCODRAFT_3751 [Conidiobolus coronatus NRRL 28638]
MISTKLNVILINLLTLALANEMPIMKVGNNDVNVQNNGLGWGWGGNPTFIVRRDDINQNNPVITQNFKVNNHPFINGGLGAVTGGMNNAGGVQNGVNARLSRRQTAEKKFTETGPNGEVFTEDIKETMTGKETPQFIEAREKALRIAEKMEKEIRERHIKEHKPHLLIDDAKDTEKRDNILEQFVLGHEISESGENSAPVTNPPSA